MKVAIVGASGFVGTRMVERWALGKKFKPMPVVRAHGSLSVLARFELSWQVTDIFDSEALAKAFEGCEAVVHAAIGDPLQIVRMAESIYRATEKAGIKRLVVLSSASVHGQRPAPATDETSPICEQHTMAYNTAKVRAEKLLQQLSASGSVEVVTLRPSVVYGPRSRWIADAAQHLLDGTACLLNEGRGICNGIYVDNLIQAIELALEIPKAAGETFLVGDAEPVTWQGFYERLAQALGIEMKTLPSIATPVFAHPFKERVADWVALPAVQRVLPYVPNKAKRLTKLLLANWQEKPMANAWQLPAGPTLRITEELALLQQCGWQLSSQKAQAILGYRPEVSFHEGMTRSIGWLAFSGFPIKP